MTKQHKANSTTWIVGGVCSPRRCLVFSTLPTTPIAKPHVSSLSTTNRAVKKRDIRHVVAVTWSGGVLSTPKHIVIKHVLCFEGTFSKTIKNQTKESKCTNQSQ